MIPKVGQNHVEQAAPQNNGARKKEAPPAPPQQPNVETRADNAGNTRKAAVAAYGGQQKDRIERLYGAGAAAASSLRDVRLAAATEKANAAFGKTYQSELNALRNPATSANPPKNLIDVSRRAETAYRGELAKQGFAPHDVRGTSVVKTADFLRAQAAKPGDLFASSPAEIRSRLAAGEQPQYFVRIMEKSRLTSPDSHLSNPKSPHVWVATPEEVAGAKLDGFETMKRVGFSDQYINQLKASGKTPADFALVVSEARGTSNQRVPTWDNVIGTAKNHPDFAAFQRKFNDPAFVEQVKSPGYKAHYEEMNRLGLNELQYAKTLPKNEQGAFLFRNRMNQKLGVNEFFTGDGRTARTDGANGGYGVREVLHANDPVASIQRNTFVDLADTGKTNLQINDRTPRIAQNPLRLGSEARNGGIAGAAISAVTSLPEVFEQARTEGVGAAAKTLIGNTAFGGAVGAASAAGERVLGNATENVLARSGIATRGLERLYSNGAARSVVQRFAGAESVASSGAFSGAARQVAGRVAGGSIVGGVVNGAFSAYDQIGAFKRGEVTGSQAIGTVTGEVGVGLAAGAAGAAAGAAIGSIVPIAGTAVGAVVGFAVGVGAGMATDYVARHFGADKAIARTVTAGIDRAQAAFSEAKTAVTNRIGEARETVGNAVNDVRNTVSNAVDNAKNTIANAVGNPVASLKSVFGW